MDEYLNEYIKFTIDNKEKTDNYNMSDYNKRMDERELDAYYDDYQKRTGKPSDQLLKNNPRSAFAPEGSIDSDMVNSPDHYTHNGIEAINVIEAKLTGEQYEGYLQGSVMKYLLRSNYKGKRDEDLKKAQWYLNTLVENNDEY
tara:strand:+ start:1539 stop:1967 length:429 start_codon:yes stop_codon:yes gene_type:complete